jgi:beta-mannosidase
MILGVLYHCVWSLPLEAAQTWTVRVEEPTGLYPRTNEIVEVPYAKLGGKQSGWQVVDQQGRELPWQATENTLLFPATLIPGELPAYHIAASNQVDTNFVNQIHLRQIGMNRLELGNVFFRILIDKQAAAMVEVFNLTAAPYRIVNLVETTPEEPEALKDDIHAAEAMGFKPIPGVPAGNTGWTSTGGTGPITQIEILESGPLRGKVRLVRTNEVWELVWAAASRALVWRLESRPGDTVNRGFRFTAISASPYLPFDRCLGGSEYEWPSGPDDAEPPDHDISARQWRSLPGGHVVYYQNEQNYGALGIVALDTNLFWTGIGSRRFIAELPGPARDPRSPQIAITFPQWAGSNTVLHARREYRVLRQPLLLELAPFPDQKTSSESGGNSPDAHSPAKQEKPRGGSLTPNSASPSSPQIAANRIPQVTFDNPTESPAPFVPQSLSLDGDWELAWREKGTGPPGDGWRTVKVPGSAHTQWLEPSKIYSPEATWVSYKEWWYRKHFNLPENFSGKRLHLQFGATDYYADTWLNGIRLGRHEGYIDPYEYDVSSVAHAHSENELVVRVWTPVDYYWKHRPYTVKGAYGAVDQKPDDITPLGITRPVHLTASEPSTIQDLAVDTRLQDDGSAEVEVAFDFSSETDPTSSVELTLSPRNFSSDEHYRVRAAIVGHSARLILPVKKPRLWWTWDHGKPNLYTLDVKLRDSNGTLVDGRSLAVGIREIERVGWTWYLNRRRLFIRGTNYYYHLYLSEMNRAAYERDLALMLQMNVNLIRLHCHFSNPEFYDVADELGVLVWQDYLEAWYPEDRSFSLRAAELYDPLIRYARNHACVASWTTCDEESLENYRDLTKHLAPRPALLDPQRRPIVRSTGRFGDAHVYHGWYDGSVWDYTNMTEPFVSELGATCLPNYDTLIEFMPNAWPIRDHAQEWFFRRLQIPEAMRAWGDPGNLSLKEYIPRTQSYVSRLFQIALERSRRLKYNPAGGICHFHAIDIWPSVTMAAIDFDRRPTKVFYTVQRSFAPVCASLEYDRDHWKPGETVRCNVYAINDRWESIPDAKVSWQIRSAKGNEACAGQWTLSMAQDSVQRLGTAEWIAAGKGPHELRAQILDQNGHQLSENIFEFDVTD